ncbi:hypothetical protein ACFXHA_43015 [Nocardia sp. NPDC059240]|uniref:hypothetical protein n=1 Tax=Nocardia sp. NPDC059240 TaxID=3346786 RepID=UPI00368B75E5
MTLAPDPITPITVQFDDLDLIHFDQAIGRWNEENRRQKLNRSVALNALARLIMRADSEEMVRQLAEKRGANEKVTEQMVKVHGWLMDEYFGVVREVIETRKSQDGRRKRKEV